jgi:hypothetical protein
MKFILLFTFSRAGLTPVVEYDHAPMSGGERRPMVAQLQAEPPDGARVWYQKHMCYHIIDGVDLNWVGSMRHCFLIREPREVLLSLSKKTDAIGRLEGRAQELRWHLGAPLV